MTVTAPSPIPMRERLRMKYDWTPRQREVLTLIAAGKTNGEIGDAMGISLDGAKWHVSEILSKLQASSREEAAEYWRRYNGLAPRFERIFRGIAGGAAVKWAAGSAAVAVAGVAAATIVAIAINQTSGEPTTANPDVPGVVTPAPDDSPGNPGPVTPGNNGVLTLAQPVKSIPNSTMYVVTGCTQCDGPDETLQKHVTDASGATTVSTILESDKGPLAGWTIGSISASPDASQLLAVTCDQDYCGGLGQGDPSTNWTVFASTDGGATWASVFETRGNNYLALFGVTRDGFTAQTTTEARSGASSTQHYRVSGRDWELLTPPASAGEFAWPFLSGDGSVLWVKGDRSGIVRNDGSVFPLAAPLGATGPAYEAVRALPSGETAIVWATITSAGDYSEIVQLVSNDGTLINTVDGNGSSRLKPVSSGIYIGNVYGATLGLPDNATSYPVVIDVAKGAITPITGDVLAQQRGRNHLVAFVQG